MKPNVLWILLDAARKDRFSCYGYERHTTPFLEKIGKESLIFKNAFANAPWTLPSIASMFTGKYPSQHGMKKSWKNRLRGKTLPQILSERGYTTFLIHSNEWVTHSELRKGFDKVITRMDIRYRNSFFPKGDYSGLAGRLYDYLNIASNEILSRNITDLARKTLEKELEGSIKPFFAFYHLTTAHLPYRPPRAFRNFSKKRFLPPRGLDLFFDIYSNWKKKKHSMQSKSKSNGFTKKELVLLRDLYDDCLFFLDYQIKRIFQWLRDKELLKDTVIIISSDHGEMLGENGVLGHNYSLAEPLLQVPLLVYGVNTEQNKIEELFEMKNMFQMILRIAGSRNRERIYEKSEYIFGEYYPSSIIERSVRKFNPYMYKGAKYLRTKNAKYLKYDLGLEKTMIVDGLREVELQNEEVRDNLARLMKIKLKELERSNVREILSEF